MSKTSLCFTGNIHDAERAFWRYLVLNFSDLVGTFVQRPSLGWDLVVIHDSELQNSIFLISHPELLNFIMTARKHRVVWCCLSIFSALETWNYEIWHPKSIKQSLCSWKVAHFGSGSPSQNGNPKMAMSSGPRPFVKDLAYAATPEAWSLEHGKAISIAPIKICPWKNTLFQIHKILYHGNLKKHADEMGSNWIWLGIYIYMILHYWEYNQQYGSVWGIWWDISVQ